MQGSPLAPLDEPRPLPPPAQGPARASAQRDSERRTRTGLRFPPRRSAAKHAAPGVRIGVGVGFVLSVRPRRDIAQGLVLDSPAVGFADPCRDGGPPGPLLLGIARRRV